MSLAQHDELKHEHDHPHVERVQVAAVGAVSDTAPHPPTSSASTAIQPRVLVLPPEVVTRLQQGDTFEKYGRKGKPHMKHISLSEDCQSLVWQSKWKKATDTCVHLSAVARIQHGRHTAKFARYTQAADEDNDLSFSIIYGTDQTLDLKCSTREQHDLWFHSLRKLVDSKQQWSVVEAESFLVAAFRAADKSGTGQLTYAETLAVLENLHIFAEPLKSAEQIIRAVDSQQSGRISCEQFSLIVDLLADHTDIERLFVALRVSETEPWILPHMFHRFLHDQQGETYVTLQEAQRRIAQLEPENEGEKLHIAGFTRYLVCSMNAAFAPENSLVYQDMTQPLSHYFIESSHNTYLEGDQLTSNSSVNMYINVLTKGCRCVELDCWDGPSGEPIIYHGHTLTSRIMFEDVVKAIRDFAFIASPYPVIMSLEVHCSPPQQDRMAAILSTVLGSMLLMPVTELDKLPSPHELQHRIIVKAKVLADNDDLDELLGLSREFSKTPVPGTVVVNNADANAVRGETPEAPRRDTTSPVVPDRQQDGAVLFFDHTTPLLGGPGEIAASGTTTPGVAGQRASRVTRRKSVVFSLSEIAFLKAQPFETLLAASNADVFRLCSLKETSLERLVRTQLWETLAYHITHLSRCYPNTLRVDSSNYDPFLGWHCGCQMVALNFQTMCKSMQLNKAMFLQNGKCGYVLKPAWMRDPALLARVVRMASLARAPLVAATTGVSAPPSAVSDSHTVVSVSPTQDHFVDDLDSVPLHAPTHRHRSFSESLRDLAKGVVSTKPVPASAIAMPVQASDANGHAGVAPANPVALAALHHAHSSTSVSAPNVLTHDSNPEPMASGTVAMPTTPATAVAPATLTTVGATVPLRTPAAIGPPHNPSLLLSGTRGPVVLDVTILSGHHLPTVDGEYKHAHLDPYCSIEIRGMPFDCAKFKSRAVSRSAMSPVWDQAFRFIILCPEIAIIRFAVKAQSELGRKTLLAYFAAPLSCIRRGTRCCRLRGMSGSKLPFCGLLCRFDASDYDVPGM